jgi:hypothetical protein
MSHRPTREPVPSVEDIPKSLKRKGLSDESRVRGTIRARRISIHVEPGQPTLGVLRLRSVLLSSARIGTRDPSRGFLVFSQSLWSLSLSVSPRWP